MTEPTQIDWARLAAFIDGEGCIEIRECLRKGTPGRPSANNLYTSYILSVGLGSTDPRLPLWCKTMFGGHISFDPRSKTNGRADGYDRKDFWYWKVASAAAEPILRGCLPYFLIKREQADVALSFRATYAVRTYGHGKGSVDPAITALRAEAVKKLVLLKKEPPKSESEVA